jgi:small subunit ribosomal protein S2
VIGLVDTNADPDEAEYVIPGNDDAIRSCDLVTRVVADGIAAGRSKVTTTEMAAPAESSPPEESPEETVAEVEAELEPEPAAIAAEGGDSE